MSIDADCFLVKNDKEFKDFYLKKLEKVIKSVKKSKFTVVSLKYTKDSPAKDFLIMGPNHDALLKYYKQLKPGGHVKILDCGDYEDGVLNIQMQYFKPATIRKWGLSEVLSIAGGWSMDDFVPDSDLTGHQFLSNAIEIEQEINRYGNDKLNNKSKECMHVIVAKFKSGNLAGIVAVRQNLLRIREECDFIEPAVKAMSDMELASRGSKNVVLLYNLSAAKQELNDGNFKAAIEFFKEAARSRPSVLHSSNVEPLSELGGDDDKKQRLEFEARRKSMPLAKIYKEVKDDMEHRIDVVLKNTARYIKEEGWTKSDIERDPFILESGYSGGNSAVFLKKTGIPSLNKGLYGLLVNVDKSTSNNQRYPQVIKAMHVVKTYMDTLEAMAAKRDDELKQQAQEPFNVSVLLLADKYLRVLRYIHSELADLLH